MSKQLKIHQCAWAQAGAALTIFSTKMTAIGRAATTLGQGFAFIRVTTTFG